MKERMPVYRKARSGVMETSVSSTAEQGVLCNKEEQNGERLSHN